MGIHAFKNLFSEEALSNLSGFVPPSLILNMSITGSIVILFVLLVRLILRKAPKVFSYTLWAVVLFRLLCPVTIATDFSLLGLFDTPTIGNTQLTTAMEYIPYNAVYTQESESMQEPGTVQGTEHQLLMEADVHEATNNIFSEKQAASDTDYPKREYRIGSIIWLLGIGVMVIYSAITYFRLHLKLIGTIRLRNNIYLADGIETPFVLGIICPKIYLPSGLSKQERRYIILHEQYHIRRGDHVVKVLAFIALCIHWFNPLVWIAFSLFTKDMEMSCDEAVVKKLGKSIRADYSDSLLSLASGKRTIAVTPLAFGEGDTKSRIKNILSWKRAKPAVIFLSAVVVILALILCGTNTSRNDSWIKATSGATSIELECNLVTPIHSYAIYEDMYEGGELVSSEVLILDSFQEEGGATPRRMTLMLDVQTIYDKESGFAGELSFYSEAAGTMYTTRKLPRNQYTGAVHVASEIGEGIFGKQKVAAEDNITLLTILLSTDPGGEVVVESLDKSLVQSNDTVVVYRLVTSEEGIEKYMERSEVSVSDGDYDVQENPSVFDDAYNKAADISYYLELAAGEDFRDMDPEKQTEILEEYEDLLDDYVLVGRESTDGKAVYIVGQFSGEATQSPLYKMYGIELSTGEEEVFQFLYPEEQSETVEAVMAANKKDFPPSSGYRIQDSRILWSADGGTVLIQPKDSELLMDVPYNRYMNTPKGREYIIDAVSRGIDVCGKTDTYLYVYRISEQFGEIAERIALTEEEAADILAEERVDITDGFGFSATLHIDGQTTYYNERNGIPQTVLDLAVERCDYRFGDPSMIADTIHEARLDCDWLETPLYAKAEDLPRLKEILKNAEFGYVGSCGYGAKLSLTFTGGEKLTLFKGTDSCDTIVFGSYGGYFLGDKQNTEFWKIFGLDPESF